MKKLISLFLALTLILSMCSMCVTVNAEEEGLPNLALGAHAWASNQYNTAGTYGPAKAVDGNTTSLYFAGSAAANGEKVNGINHLVVDLGAIYDLNSVIVRTRRDDQTSIYRQGWVIYTSEDSSFKNLTEIGSRLTAGDYKTDTEIVFKKPHTARYILIKTVDRFLAVAEVEAYGQESKGKVVRDSYPDVPENWFDALKLVEGLSIMEPFSADEFGINKLVTRSEAAKFASLAANLPEIETEASSFSDVEATDENIGFIERCLTQGIISKADAYRPGDFVKVSEFLKMMLTAMGYDAVLPAYGTYPDNVMLLANKVGLLKNVSLKGDESINRGAILNVIYNALMTPTNALDSFSEDRVMYDQGELFLKKAFNMTLNKGKVTENDVTGLLFASSNGKNKVKIDGTLFYDLSGKVRELIGQSICYILDEEGNIVIGWENKRANQIYTIYTKDIDSAAKYTIETYDEATDETTTYDFNNPYYVLKNGVAYGGYVPSQLKNIANGTVKLIDSDKDGYIDVMHIYEPIVIVADSAYEKNGKLFVGGINGEKLDKTGYTHFAATTNGGTVLMEQIAKGNLVYAYVSENGKSITLDVIRNSVEGVLESIEDDMITVDGEIFGLSKYYLNNQAKLPNLLLNMEAKFIFDAHGDLVWIDEVGLKKGSEALGLLQVYDIPTGYNQNISVKLFSEKSEFLIYELADRVTMDGSRYTQDQLKTFLGENPRYLVGKFALYVVNSDGKINKLDTENFDSLKEPDSQMVQMNAVVSSGNRKEKHGIYSANTQIIPIIEDFPMFMIPVNADKVPLMDEEYEELYAVSSIEKKIPRGNVKLSGETRFYGTDELGCPTFCVNMRIIDTEGGTGSYGVITEHNDQSIVVSSMSKRTLTSGETTYAITGYNINTGAKQTLVLEASLNNVVESQKLQADIAAGTTVKVAQDEYKYIDLAGECDDLVNYLSDVSTIKCGDILRFGLSGAEVISLERIYNNDPLATTNYGKIYAAGDDPTRINVSYRIWKSLFEDAKKNVMMLKMRSSATTTEKAEYIDMKGGFYTFEDGRLTKRELSEIPAYCVGNDVVTLTVYGTYTAMIAYLN